MFSINTLHRDESGQTALETAIILIAFVVVASVFAFTILSAGSASTEKGEQAIYSGLENVQSSMTMKGAMIAKEDTTAGQVGTLLFSVALAGGGDPVDLSNTGGNNAVVIGYRDANQVINEVKWSATFIGNSDTDTLLEDGELAEITVDLAGTAPALNPVLAKNTEFTIEVKPPTGAVLNITRSTPAGFSAVMELR